MPRATLPLALVFLWICGCGGPATVPVKGTLQFEDGKPVGGASLLFQPRDPEGKIANGFTRKDGSFTLTTPGTGDGIFPGEYVVAVTKGSTEIHTPPIEGEITPEALAKQMREAMRNAKKTTEPVPALYGDPNSSPLTATIEAGKIDLLLKIKR